MVLLHVTLDIILIYILLILFSVLKGFIHYSDFNYKTISQSQSFWTAKTLTYPNPFLYGTNPCYN